MPSTTSPDASAVASRAPRWKRWGRAVLLFVGCWAAGFLVWAVGLGLVLETTPVLTRAQTLAVGLVDPALGLLLSAAVGPMRRAGRWNLAIAAIGCASTWAGPAVLVALTRLGRERSLPLAVTAVALVTAISMGWEGALYGFDGMGRGDILAMAVLMAALGTAFVLWGWAQGTRTALIASLRAQAASAEEARAALVREHEALATRREAEVDGAVARERTALARDMHDSVAHHLAVISLHAGALAYREDMPPEQARELGATLRESAQRANSELASVLAALREGSGIQSTAPLLGEDWFEELLAREEALGARVEARREVDVTALPRTVATALERSLAEALLNARKHSPGAPVQVTLRHLPAPGGAVDGEADRVMLTVRNPIGAWADMAGTAVGDAPAGSAQAVDGQDAARTSARGAPGASREETTAPVTGTGFGLIGLAERARLLGGRARSDTTTGEDGRSMFEVEVELPWETPA